MTAAHWNAFHAADYGQLAIRFLALARVHADGADAALAVWLARKAGHFGAACLPPCCVLPAAA